MTNSALMLDLIAGAVLLLFCILGCKRGLLRTLSGWFFTLLALFGAKYLADSLAGALGSCFVPGLLPHVTKKLAETMSDAAVSTAGQGNGLGLLGLLPAVRELVDNAAGAVAESIAPAVAEAAAEALAWLVIFIVSFILLRLLFKLVRKLLNLLDRLPGLHFLNHATGALLGLVEGVLLVELAAALLLFFGMLSRPVIEETWLLSIFI